jgi:hypothetical protein
MIQSENAPTLCPRCVHFTKGAQVGCRIANYDLDNPALDVQRWLREQIDESSWTGQGACPRFLHNGSTPHLMSPSDQGAFQKLSRVGR